MIPASFDYQAPTSVDEALSLLRQGGDEAKILAGGHSLLPLMKLRLAAPAALIDLRLVPGLRYIRDAGDHIAIGAMTPYADLLTSDVIRRRLPLLTQSANLVGDPQVRNCGTLGGAIAHADPAGDMPAVCSALGGSVVARGPGGERTIDLNDPSGNGHFFQDIFTSALAPDELLTEIRLRPQEGAGSYQKFTRRAIDWAIVGVAVTLRRDNGSIGSANVVLSNVGRTPMRASGVEDALRGQPANADTARQAAQLADRDLDPTGDLNASAAYKRQLARVMTRRALEEALNA